MVRSAQFNNILYFCVPNMLLSSNYVCASTIHTKLMWMLCMSHFLIELVKTTSYSQYSQLYSAILLYYALWRLELFVQQPFTIYPALCFVVAQFMHVLRQRIQLGATESIYLMVNGVTPTTRSVLNTHTHTHTHTSLCYSYIPPPPPPRSYW